MKNFSYLLITIIIFILCQKIEIQHSCDPNIDQCVIENIKDLSLSDIKELSSYDYLLQKTIFNSWKNKDNRKALLVKLNYFLSDRDFDNNEIHHIYALNNHIRSDYFSSKYVKQNNKEISQFKNGWINYAQKVLRWTIHQICLKVESLMSSMFRKCSILNPSGGRCDFNMTHDFFYDVICFPRGSTVFESYDIKVDYVSEIVPYLNT